MTSRNRKQNLWGRPMETYVQSYDHDCFKQTASLDTGADLDLRNRARTAITGICELVSMKESDGDKLAAQITLSMLRSIIDLTLLPGGLVELGYPDLVGGCIKLMGTVKLSGKCMPFRYEYGYLCFRILVIALDVCLLQRAGRFDGILARIQVESEAEVLLILSKEVSELVQNAYTDEHGIKHFDWMLGLVSGSIFGPPQQVFMDSHGPVDLVSCLHQDRKTFLNVLNSTYFPGLSAVFCLLWRYMNSPIHDKSNTRCLDEDLASSFREMFFRYCLVAPGIEQAALVAIYSHDVSWWKPASQVLIDQEDSRQKLVIYNQRLASIDTHCLFISNASIIPILLRYLSAKIHSGVEDLLPELFGLTIQRLWDTCVDERFPSDLSATITCYTFTYLKNIVTHLQDKSYSNQLVVVALMQSLAENDMINLIMKVAFSLPILRDDEELLKS
ncbi:hypothetical protein RHS02_08752, partial [Rhizoctonia solani]